MSKSIRMTCRPLFWLLATVLCVSLAWAGPTGMLNQTDETSPVGTATDSESVEKTKLDDSEYEYQPVGELPDWIANFESHSEDDTTDVHLLVSSDMYRFQRESINEMWNNAEIRVASYLDDQIAAGAGNALNVDRDTIRESLKVREHMHLFRTPNPVSLDGEDPEEALEWHRSWVELSIDEEFRSWANDRYEEHLVRSRVMQTALLVLSGIALLGIAYGFLHLNHRTRGFYSGRLQTITLLAALVVVAVVVALSNSFAWL